MKEKLVELKNLLESKINLVSLWDVLKIVAIVAVMVKFFIFYRLMDVNTNFEIIYFTSLLLVYLFFSAFKNKKYFAIVFCMFSILMFCDVTYNSYFNRYLSISMIGAARFIVDIGDIIKQTIRPINFIMLLDAGIILIVEIIGEKKLKAAEISNGSNSIKDIAKHKIAECEIASQISHKIKHIFCCTDNMIDIWKKKYHESVEKIRSERIRIFLQERNGRRIISIALAIIILISAIFNPANITVYKTIRNQEFFSYHISDIYEAISQKDSGSLSAWTDSYVEEIDGELFGIAEGKNVVMIQLESFQNFVIGMKYNGQEITPNLNKLIKGNSTYFDNFYQQIGSGNTSDAEFASNNSIVGSITSYTYNLYDENYLKGIPVLLKEKGYSTAVFHAYEDRSFWNRSEAYVAEGFDRYYGGLKEDGGDYEVKDYMGWGIADSQFFTQTVKYMKELKEPYYNFVITLSNHRPFKILNKYKMLELGPELENNIVGDYLQTVAYTDYSIGVLMDQLKNEGLYDDTIFVIYGDHGGIVKSDNIDKEMKMLLDEDFDYQHIMNVPLIIHMPDSSVNIHQKISTAGGQTDILPTLAYLLGFKKLDTIYVGHNLYTVKENIVPQQMMMIKGSFFSNDIAYEMSRDGVFENGRGWNIHTGETVDVSLCYEGYLKSLEVIDTSEYILRTDAIRKIFLEGSTAKDINNIKVRRIYPDYIVESGYPDKNMLGRSDVDALNNCVNHLHRDIFVNAGFDKNGELFLKDRRTGDKTLSGSEIVKWMADHGSNNIYFFIEKDGENIKEYLNKTNKLISARAIVVTKSAETLSRDSEAMLDLTDGKISVSEAKKLMKKYDLWGAVVSKEHANTKYKELLNMDITVYILEEDDGIINKVELK